MNAPIEPRGEAHLPVAAEQRTQSLAAPPAIPQNAVKRGSYETGVRGPDLARARVESIACMPYSNRSSSLIRLGYEIDLALSSNPIEDDRGGALCITGAPVKSCDVAPPNAT